MFNLINLHNPDFIAATETWLAPSILNSEIFPTGYDIFRKDRSDGYGGVLFACRSNIQCTQITLNTPCEVIACKINSNNRNPLIFVTIYRPPHRDLLYMQNLRILLEELITSYFDCTIWLTGDLNLPDIDWNTLSVSHYQYPTAINNHFVDLIGFGGFTQLVDTPTRDNRILDIFATNQPSHITSCHIVPGISDHEAIYIESKLAVYTTPPTKRKVYLWNRANFCNINDVMLQQCSQFIQDNNEHIPIEELWSKFKTICKDCLDLIPSRLTSKRHNQPWINNHIKQITRKKRRLYNKARTTNLLQHWSAYRNIKKIVQRECRQAHNQYISDLLDPHSDRGHKRLWTYIKSKRKDTSGISSLVVNDTLYSKDTDKASILNSHFSSVFTREHLNGPTNLKTPLSSRSSDIQIHVEGVASLLRDLQSHKACGPDGIPPRLLKETANNVAPALTLLYKASLAQGQLPNDWKKSYVVPVFKKGSRTSPANYRPISLTCIPCKVFEHIIYSNIYHYLSENNILCAQQHGFRKNHSCESQLIATVNDFATYLNAGEQVDVISLDLSKAFDKVPHQKLLYKLSSYGINTSTLNWIKDYLSNRTQQVVINNVTSNPCSVISGVPQGSVLGPLLFLLYINDFPEGVSSTVRLYADDALLYRVIRTREDIQALQQDLNILLQWSTDWQMVFNLDKCEHLQISLKRHSITSQYTLSGSPIKCVPSIKYLGVIINSSLTWSSHVTYITNKANSVRAFLQRNISRCLPSVKVKCYETYVRPILEYCSTVWAPHTLQDCQKLETVQRRMARFIFNDYSYTSSVTRMLQDLHWATLKQRRTQAKLITLYKIVHNILYVPTNNILIQTTPSYPIRNHHTHHFVVPSARLESYKQSFFPSTIVLWNSLSPNIVLAPDIDSFKDTLEQSLLN